MRLTAGKNYLTNEVPGGITEEGILGVGNVWGRIKDVQAMTNQETAIPLTSCGLSSPANRKYYQETSKKIRTMKATKNNVTPQTHHHNHHHQHDLHQQRITPLSFIPFLQA